MLLTKRFILIGLLQLTFSSFSQVTTSNNQTIEYYVQNVLLGTGVSVSNIQFGGGSANIVHESVGSFNDPTSSIGLPNGLIMGSGDVQMAAQPNIDSGGSLGGSSIPGSQDPDLFSISNWVLFNESTIEFDFVPNGNLISFRYVFASEEYPEFVCSNANDVFGFFLTGTNPNGTNYVSKNIALLPDPNNPSNFTNIPVSINTLNSGTAGVIGNSNTCDMANPNWAAYSVFYAGNNTGTNYEYDGNSVVLTAQAAVNCGETYHIKLGIADVGDRLYDSGVFIEAGSFSSNIGTGITSQIITNNSNANDSTIIETCGDADIWFHRQDSINFAQNIQLIISGTATNGTDYSQLQSNITFPAGQDSVSFNVSALADNLSEPLEYIQFKYEYLTACSNPVYDSIRLYIQNNDPINIQLPSETTICQGDSLNLSPVISGGSHGYSYLWNTGDTSLELNINPINTTTYKINVTDSCGQTSTDSITVFVPVTGVLLIELPNDTIINCNNSQISLIAQIVNGDPNASITWSNGNQGDTITFNATNSTTLIATAQDICGNSDQDTMNIILNEVPVQSVISNDTLICKGDSVLLTVMPSGGTGGDYSFSWNTGESDSSILVYPLTNITYYVEISDGCNYVKKLDSVEIDVSIVEADFTVNGSFEINNEIAIVNQSIGASSYFWDFGNNQTSTLQNPSTYYDEIKNYTITLWAENDQGCTDSTIKVIEIKPEINFYAPNSFTPDGDEFNNEWRVFGTGIDPYDFVLIIYDRWGEIIWESHDPSVGWDGTLNGISVQSGTYIWKVSFKALNDVLHRELVGHVTLLK
jgi:gliding motility-associated-like protein